MSAVFVKTHSEKKYEHALDCLFVCFSFEKLILMNAKPHHASMVTVLMESTNSTACVTKDMKEHFAMVCVIFILIVVSIPSCVMVY